MILKDYSRKPPSPPAVIVEVGKQSQDSEKTKKRPLEEISSPEKEQQAFKQKIDNMAEQFDCGICFMIMHQPVSLIPCLHTYCGGCFADWMERSKECPNCRKPVMMVNKNAQTNSTIESYLLINPQLKRDPKEIEELEKKNVFKNEVVRIIHLCDIFSLLSIKIINLLHLNRSLRSLHPYKRVNPRPSLRRKLRDQM